MTIVVSNVNDKVITTSETNADEPIRRTLPADTKGLANNGKLLLDRGEPLTNGTIVTHKTSSTLKIRRLYHTVTDNATPIMFNVEQKGKKTGTGTGELVVRVGKNLQQTPRAHTIRREVNGRKARAHRRAAEDEANTKHLES